MSATRATALVGRDVAQLMIELATKGWPAAVGGAQPRRRSRYFVSRRPASAQRGLDRPSGSGPDKALSERESRSFRHELTMLLQRTPCVGFPRDCCNRNHLDGRSFLPDVSKWSLGRRKVLSGWASRTSQALAGR